MEFEEKLFGFEGTEDDPDGEYDDVLTLVDENGEEVNFIEIAGIAYKGSYYMILQPEELVEDMEEDDAFCFKVTRDKDGGDHYEMVTDDEIIDAVFGEYNKLYEEATS